MTFHEEKEKQTQFKVTNTSGATYVQGQLVMEQGYFGKPISTSAIYQLAHFHQKKDVFVQTEHESVRYVLRYFLLVNYIFQ